MLQEQALEFLYTDTEGLTTLADKPRLIPVETFDGAMKHIQKRGAYSPKMLKDKPLKKWINDTYGVLKRGVDAGIADNVIPDEMAAHLDMDTFLFSGFKVHSALEQANLRLRNNDGSIKSFEKFRQDVDVIDARYNKQYLAAEYQFAISSSQSAANWAQMAEDGDTYNLQYRTAGDEAVRESHRALDGVTLPASDPFWNKFYPPNGWNCRCDTVQVRKSKYPVSDSQKAQTAGAKATTHINRKGQNKLAIFRFNPGKEQKIFPPKHPYYKAEASVGKTLEKMSEEQSQINAFNSAINGAKQKSEIEKLTAQELNRVGHKDIAVSFKNVDINTAKLYATEFAALLREYHTQGVVLGFNTNPPKGNYGQVVTFKDSGSKIIKVGKDVYLKRVSPVADLKSRCDENKLQISTLTHEFAHVIHTKGTKVSNKEFLGEMNDLMLEYRECISNNVKGTNGYRKNYMGNYATTEVDEFMAEAFQEYKNYSTPSVFAIKAGRIIDEYFKK